MKRESSDGVVFIEDHLVVKVQSQQLKAEIEKLTKHVSYYGRIVTFGIVVIAALIIYWVQQHMK
jgi:hypothetical protein